MIPVTVFDDLDASARGVLRRMRMIKKDTENEMRYMGGIGTPRASSFCC